MRKSRWSLSAILAILTIPTAVRGQQPIHWESSIDTAKRIASQSNRLVLVVFTAPSWCQACRALENDLATQPGIGPALEANYVPVKINTDFFPNTVRQYAITGWPTTLVLAPTRQGEVLDTIRGRLPMDKYLDRLNQVAIVTRQRNSAALAQIPSEARPNNSPPNGTAVAMVPSGSAPAAYAMATPDSPSDASHSMGRPANGGHPPIGLDGYCPVQLTEKAVWSVGNKSWGAIHRGRTYLFAGESERSRFLADPDRYAPVSSGDDVVLALDQGRTVPGNRRHGLQYGGHIYLFADEPSLEKFLASPKYYAERALQATQTGTPSGSQMR